MTDNQYNYTLSVILLHPSGECDPSACLDSLDRALDDGDEVMLVAAGGAREMEELQERVKDRGIGIPVLAQPGGDAGAARNFAASQARGDILFFSQTDCALPSGLSKMLRQAFEDPALDGLGGGCLALNTDEPLARLVGWELSFDRQNDYEPDSLCSAFRCQAFMAAGGFDPADEAEGLENYELSSRLLAAGARLQFEPEITVRRVLPHRWGQYLRLAFNLGHNRFRNTLHRRRLGLAGGGTLSQHLQSVLILFALGLPIALWQYDQFRGLLWSAICLLLLYPLNRGFLKYLAEKEPELMHKALVLCLLRPWAWTAGLVKAALDRMGGNA